MNDDIFQRMKLRSEEIHSLVRQGVKKGVKEKIEQRNALLQLWFSSLTQATGMTAEQKSYLDTLLSREKDLLGLLAEEQQAYFRHKSGVRKVSQYERISRTKK